MWIVVFLLVFAFLLYVFPFARCIIFTGHRAIPYFFRDFYLYFRHKKYNLAPTGKLAAYTAHFGGGKTLSCVMYLDSMYRRYNNKQVYCYKRKKFVTQKVIIISNVVLQSMNYIHLESLKQIVEIAKAQKDYDSENDTRTVYYIFIDEASSELNSRNFRDNINMLFLNTLITCRHYNLNFIYTTQKFRLTDALLRTVTQTVIECSKTWRVVTHKYYNADDVEQAQDVRTLRPLRSSASFVTDRVFGLYDTFATVSTLTKNIKESELLSAEEIKNSLMSITVANDEIAQKKYKRRFRK